MDAVVSHGMRRRQVKPNDRLWGVARLILVLACAVSFSDIALADGLGDEVAKIVTARKGGMSVGVRVDRLSQPIEIVYDYNGDELLKPASNQKIITSAAALALLPERFTYRTVLARRGDDLVVVGSGDPSTGDPRLAQTAGESITAFFHEWAKKLESLGVRQITGDLIFDDTVFETKHLHPSWQGMFNLQSWYTAPVGGLNFNDNCIDVVSKPTQPGQPAEITLIPNTPYVELRNNTKTASKGEPIISRTGDDPVVVNVSGNVSRATSAENPFSLTTVDPGKMFASTLRTVLASRGIAVRGDLRREQIRNNDGTLPSSVKVIAVHETQIEDWLWRVNKNSQNMFAEALFKTVGYATDTKASPRVGTNENAARALQQFVEKLGVATEGMVFDDGSGLSHNNRTSAAAIAVTLAMMHRHPKGELFRSSLAVPGDGVGTLKSRMRDLDGRVFAKTGTIRGVSALSGYVQGSDGRMYAFSVLCNDTHKTKGGTSAAKRLQDEVCKLLATWEPEPAVSGG